MGDREGEQCVEKWLGKYVVCDGFMIRLTVVMHSAVGAQPCDRIFLPLPSPWTSLYAAISDQLSVRCGLEVRASSMLEAACVLVRTCP